MTATKNRIKLQSVPEWETILTLYAPLVAFFIGVFSGNLPNMLAIGAIYVGFISLVIMILLNIVFRVYKLENALMLLFYKFTMHIGSFFSLIVFVVVVAERTVINPTQSILLLVLMCVLLLYGLSNIDLFSSRYFSVYETSLFKAFLAVGIVFFLVLKHAVWLQVKLVPILGTLLPFAKLWQLQFLSPVIIFFGSCIPVLGLMLMFEKATDLVRYLLKRNSFAFALRIAMMFSLLVFAVIAIFF